MTSPPRDGLANLKLLGGLARLDALQPDGFTCAELAAHAGADPETARAFLQPAKGQDYVEVISSRRPTEGQEGRGRPANVYRLAPKRRSDLFLHLANLRRELDSAIAFDPPVGRDAYSPLDLLGGAIDELAKRDDRPEAWRGRLEEARTELLGAEGDLRALRARGDAKAAAFADRFETLQNRLAAVERGGAPDDVTLKEKDLVDILRRRSPWPRWAPAGLQPAKAAHVLGTDPFIRLVARYGTWASGKPATATADLFEPTLVLFDGVPGESVVANTLEQSCRAADMRVALFDIANMASEQRVGLYAALNQLRSSTPLAVSDFVLTVDGRMDIAQTLASEFCAFNRPGVSPGSEAAVAAEIADVDLRTLREFYVDQSRLVSMLETTPVTVEAGRISYALELCDVVGMIAKRATDSAEPPARYWEGRDLLIEARSVMGKVVCVDASHSDAIAVTLEDQTVSYVADFLKGDRGRPTTAAYGDLLRLAAGGGPIGLTKLMT